MQPGQIIANRYAIERLAGSGGMGAVYCALDRQTGARIAIKVLHGHGADHAARFAREARLLSELQHPGIVRYLDHGATDAGDGFIAMEWLEGEDLSTRLKRAGPLAIPEVLALAAQVASALRVAHERGIVHRDLKPANLFLVGGSIERVKILDFGIARVLTATTRITVSGEMLGTPGYMSPEQARGEHEVDARSDVFSLGCILFRCVTGRRPFQASDPLSILLKTLANPVPRLGELREDVPPALDELVDRMLAKLPAERPRDAGAVLEELRAMTGAPGTRTSASRAAGPSRGQTSLLAPDACFLLARFPGGRLPAALTREALSAQISAAQGAAAAQGALLDVLADGSLLVTAPSEPRVADQAAATARCALSLRGLIPGMALAIFAGSAGAAAPPIEEGVRILERTAGAAIGVDAVAARLLEGRFEIAMIAGGFALAGERRAAAGPQRLELGGAGTGARETEPSVEATWSRPALREPTPRHESARDAAQRLIEETWTDPQAPPPVTPAPAPQAGAPLTVTVPSATPPTMSYPARPPSAPSPPQPPGVPRRGPTPAQVGTVIAVAVGVLGLGLMALLGLGIWVGLSQSDAEQGEPEERNDDVTQTSAPGRTGGLIPTAAAPQPAATAQGLPCPAEHRCAFIALKDPTRVDPLEVLPSARQLARQFDPDAMLLRFWAKPLSRGAVDVRSRADALTFAFLVKPVPRIGPGTDETLNTVTVALRGPGDLVAFRAIQSDDEPSVAPTCTLAEAIRAAAAAGFPEGAINEATYRNSAWVLGGGSPRKYQRVDGRTCRAIER